MMTLLNGTMEGGPEAPLAPLRWCLPDPRSIRRGSTLRKRGMDASVSERRLSVNEEVWTGWVEVLMPRCSSPPPMSERGDSVHKGQARACT